MLLFIGFFPLILPKNKNIIISAQLINVKVALMVAKCEGSIDGQVAP
jgi:hypothetical protein